MDPSKINDLNDLESLLALMARHGLSELSIETEGRKIHLKKCLADAEPAMARSQAAMASAMPAAAFAGAGAAPSPAAPQLPPGIHEVKSPMVGTFYRAPSPEADPFVREGDRVEETTTLCIIEAMKVMNEIPAGIAGVVKEILLKNGESVEFGQPLFHIATESA